MSFFEAVRTCFRKYVTFSGRASRLEYWWFVLFLLLGSAAAGLLDAALFRAADFQAESADGRIGITARSDGPIAAAFSLATVVPALAAGWRRMHDTGRSGLYLLYPLIVIAGLATFAALTGMPGGALPAPDDAPSALEGALGLIFIAGTVVFFISPLLVIWWLTRPSEPAANQYGPNLHEVTP